MCPVARDHIVKLAGGVVRARVHGDGDGPPLLMLNGLGAPLELFEPLVHSLGQRRTIVFDAPGSGQSEAPRLPMTIGDHARLAIELLDRLGVDHVDVLGLSFGGMVAQELAHIAPRRVERLVLASTSCGWGGVPGTPAAVLAITTPERYYSRTAFEAAAPQYVGGRETQNGAFLQRQAREREIHPPSVRGYMYQFWAAASWSSLLWLPELTQPTLVIAGEVDPLIPALNAQLLATLIPHATTHIVSRGGHLCLLEQASALAPVILDFLSGPSESATGRRGRRAASAPRG